MQKGYIYIMTNPSFPNYVKLGYSNDVKQRLKELNRSECIPFAFRVYATYEVESKLTDKNLHAIIDQLNPTLRAVDEFNGKPRKREFYAMSKEDAYALLQSIAQINGRMDKLELWPETKADKMAEDTAELVETEIKLPKKTQPIPLEEYFANKEPELVSIYKILQSDIYDKLDGVEMNVLPQYIGWKINGKYFADFCIQKSQIVICTVKTDKEYSIGTKVPDNFGWALNYRTYIDSCEDLNKMKTIIVDSYIKKGGIMKAGSLCGGIESVEILSKKKKPLTFEMIDIPVGSTLVFRNDENITVKTYNKHNKVEYQGVIYSISSVVSIIRNDNLPHQGGAWFKYEGELLTERRERMGK